MYGVVAVIRRKYRCKYSGPCDQSWLFKTGRKALLLFLFLDKPDSCVEEVSKIIAESREEMLGQVWITISMWRIPLDNGCHLTYRLIQRLCSYWSKLSKALLIQRGLLFFRGALKEFIQGLENRVEERRG